ncbi:FAD-binding oxidoreductase [Thermodesulfobacteriota bacterium]
MYRKLDETILKELRQIAGEDSVLVSEEARDKYSHDEVAELRSEPEAVVMVKSADVVAAVMKLAQRENFPVTPRGAGYGLSGGAVPAMGGVVMSLEKMNRILEIDHENLMVTVEPGVITGDLHRAVEEVGLFYPPDPASLDSCSIGGNIAENAGGPRAVKYGVTRDYVCGLEAVLPSGETVRMGGKVVKNVTGYNLLQLMLGSEGTLAVIVKILLRLLPLPKERIDLLVPFNNFEDAAKSVSEIISNKIVPTALEFMGSDSIEAVERYSGKEVPFHEAGAHLLITIDGNDKDSITDEYERTGEICLKNGALNVLVAADSLNRDRLWGARRLILEALPALSSDRIMDTMDIVVPRSRIADMLEKIEEIKNRYELPIISFGHAGDGNIHVNIIKNITDEEWKLRAPKAAEEVYKIAVSLGGFITGEHGIGMTRKRYLSLGVDEHQIAIMKGIKKEFDPNNILNPGKIFE